MDWWIPLLASVTGGLIAGSVALLGVILTLRNVHRQERLKDERALRDAKRDRLVRSYATLLRVAREVKYAAASLTSPLTDQPSTDRLEQANDRIRDLLSDYERAAVELRLESDGRALVELGDRIFALFFYHQAQTVAMSARGDGLLLERVEEAVPARSLHEGRKSASITAVREEFARCAINCNRSSGVRASTSLRTS